MRCRDVTRELAAPNGALDAAELARHLESCPRCAERAEQAERFDRLWEATRPVEPPGGFDAIWADVTRALDAPQPSAEDRPAAIRARRRRRLVIAIVGLAQAAVLLVAVTVILRHRPQGPEIARVEPTKDIPVTRVDIDPMQTVFIQVDPGLQLVVRAEDNNSMDDLDVLNTMEALAE